MITLKQFMFPENASSALLRAFQLILQAMDLHTLQGDELDYGEFRRSVRELLEKYTQNQTNADVLMTTGILIKTYQDYNMRTDRFFRLKASEMQRVIGLLSNTVAMLTEGNRASVDRLQLLASRIHKASVAEDLTALKSGLSDCLDVVNQQITDHRAAVEHARILASEVAQSATQLSSPVENAPEEAASMTDCEKVLATRFKQTKGGFAAFFVLEQIGSIKSRYGEFAADEVLYVFEQELGRTVPGQNTVCRWTEPTFLAFFEGVENENHVRSLLSRLVNRKLSTTVTASGRQVMLAIHFRWTLLPLLASMPVKQFTAKLEEFVRRKDD